MHQSFDVVLPTRSIKAARMQIERAFLRQSDQLWNHEGHYTFDTVDLETILPEI